MSKTFALNADNCLETRPAHIPADLWSQFSLNVQQTNETHPIAINANDLTFGVEIETHVSNAASIEGGRYHSGHTTSGLPAFNGARWGVERDSSIEVPSYTRRGVEFISPILKGEAGLKNLIDVVNVIKAEQGEQVTIETPVQNGNATVAEEFEGQGARVNRSCGIHIHVGFPTNDLRALQRLASLVASLEDGIYASTGSAARRNGVYSRPTKCDTGRKSTVKSKSQQQFNNAWAGSYSSRYFGLNLSNLINGTRPTVEFRFFSGSTNPRKIAAWTQLCLGLVQLALSSQRSAPWESKQASNWYGKDKSQPEREVQRLMQKLGWVHRRDDNTFGILGIVGEGNGLPTRLEMARELRKLARKFND